MAGISGGMEIDIGESSPFLRSGSISFSTCPYCYTVTSVGEKCACLEAEIPLDDFKPIMGIQDLSRLKGLHGEIGVRKRASDENYCLVIRIPFGKEQTGLDTASKLCKLILGKNE